MGADPVGQVLGVAADTAVRRRWPDGETTEVLAGAVTGLGST